MGIIAQSTRNFPMNLSLSIARKTSGRTSYQIVSPSAGFVAEGTYNFCSISSIKIPVNSLQGLVDREYRIEINS